MDSTNVPGKYNYEDAVKNGDVVDLHGKMINTDKLNNFVDNVDKGHQDKVRITRYTIEGDPILYTLEYNGKIINYTVDTSRDAFGGTGKGIRSYQYSKAWKEDKQIELGEGRTVAGIAYILGNDEGDKTEVIIIRK